MRETEEEFGITPKGMISIGTGAVEPGTGLKPVIFLCTDYDGEIKCEDAKMCDPKFMSLSEIVSGKNFFKPFVGGLDILCRELDIPRNFGIIKDNGIHSDYGKKGMKWGQHKAGAPKLSRKESKKFYSEVSTNYYKRFSCKVGKDCGMFIGNNYYRFKNNGFGDYTVTEKCKIEGSEDYIKYLEESEDE